jgi:glycine hydroxymethyltransferase
MSLQRSQPVSDRLPSTFTDPLSIVDPEIAAVLQQELGRQRDYLEMIASENWVR